MITLRKTFQPITGVLAATDLQHGSDAVLSAAASIARMADARLHLIHVLTSGALPPRVQRDDPEAIYDALEEARRGLWIQANSLDPNGLDMASEVVVRDRSIHPAITGAARAAGVDLIVLGTHARPDLGDRLGSTADRVVRTTPIPCLVVRGEPSFPVHRAAVLTDLSPVARVGLRLAFSWLPALGLADSEGCLDVLHVTWPESLEEPGPAPLMRPLENEIARALEGVRRGPTSVKPRVVFSYQTADAVIREARERDYQLIVVATHGHGPLARALVGSVTLGLLHRAPCPVLVVPRERPKR